MSIILSFPEVPRETLEPDERQTPRDKGVLDDFDLLPTEDIMSASSASDWEEIERDDFRDRVVTGGMRRLR